MKIPTTCVISCLILQELAKKIPTTALLAMHSQPRLEPERVDLVRGREPEHRARPEHDIQEQREHEADAAAAVRRHQRVHARERVAGGGVDVEAQLVRRVRLQEAHVLPHPRLEVLEQDRVVGDLAHAHPARELHRHALLDHAREVVGRDAPREDGHVRQSLERRRFIGVRGGGLWFSCAEKSSDGMRCEKMGMRGKVWQARVVCGSRALRSRRTGCAARRRACEAKFGR